MMAHALHGFAAALVPQSCVLCGGASGRRLLCDECSDQLPHLRERCPRCALPSPGGQCCGRCLVSPPRFDAAVAALAYAFPADRLLQALKYGGQLAIADALGDALAHAVQRSLAPAALPQAIVPLPLSPARQRERGFNQAAEIARALSQRLCVPVLHALARPGDAPAQAGLARRLRQRNVRGAFVCTRPVRGVSVAVVDDVMTTGATLEAAARTLRSAGAVTIHAWAAARTLPR